MKEVLSKKRKLRREESFAQTGSCNAIFQRQLPLKKNDPGSFYSIGKLSIKEARSGLVEGINSIMSLLIKKIKRIQV